MRNHINQNKHFCFFQWSRNKLGILISLNRVIKIGVLCTSYSLLNRMPLLMSQPDTISVQLKMLEIEEVQVTGRRSQAVFSDISRVVSVISKKDIEGASVHNINDLIERVSNTDIRQRGNYGIQADVSIRGGSYDHVMVLINGINVSDPQTGHLSMDLPVNIESIEKIEILDGSAARVLGSGALTGAINIITKRVVNDEGMISFAAGDYGYNRTQVFTGYKTGNIDHLFTASTSSSRGYIDNTDFRISNIYYRGNLNFAGTLFDAQIGFQKKDFGASGFYSPRFPNQYEEAGTWLASLKMTTGNKLRVSPVVYWRHRKDHYLLDRENPDFYENFHQTDVFGSQLNISYNINRFFTSFGYDLRSEGILSNNIGYELQQPVAVKGWDSAYYTRNFSRTNVDLFHESGFVSKKIQLTAGFMVHYNSDNPHKLSLYPGIDLNYSISMKYSAFFSINRSLRLPSFTDMFYKDPVNKGNINLKPNELLSFEGGLKSSSDNLNTCFSVFYLTGRNIIDWLWSYQTNRYSPVNLSSYSSTGFSSAVSWSVPGNRGMNRLIKSLNINYMFLNVQKSAPDEVSKYNNLKHKIAVSINQQITGKLLLRWFINYQDREGEVITFDAMEMKYYSLDNHPFWFVDGSITWSTKYMEIYSEISNIFNTRYIDAGSVVQPGRWIKVGLNFKLKVDKKSP